MNITLSLNDKIHNSEGYKLPQKCYSKQNGTRKWICSNEWKMQQFMYTQLIWNSNLTKWSKRRCLESLHVQIRRYRNWFRMSHQVFILQIKHRMKICSFNHWGGCTPSSNIYVVIVLLRIFSLEICIEEEFIYKPKFMYRLWKGCIFVKMYLLWCTNRYLWMQPYDIKWYHCLK